MKAQSSISFMTTNGMRIRIPNHSVGHGQIQEICSLQVLVVLYFNAIEN